MAIPIPGGSCDLWHIVFLWLNKWSCWMKARALIDGAPFGPETVKAIGEAFDQASARIKRIFRNDPDAVEAARDEAERGHASGCSDIDPAEQLGVGVRSEERRVGKEG